jgi:hypothetical protein
MWCDVVRRNPHGFRPKQPLVLPSTASRTAAKPCAHNDGYVKSVTLL